jgi:hypothetical protein
MVFEEKFEQKNHRKWQLTTNGFILNAIGSVGTL